MFFGKFNEILLKIFIKIKLLAILAFSVGLKDLYDTDHSQPYVYLFNFKSNRNCLILQDVLLPQCWKYHANRWVLLEAGITIEHEKKQQKTEAQPCWEMIPHYPLHSCWEERLDKLINLSFSYLSASAAQISPPSKAVSSDIQETPSHPQDEAPVGSPDTKQEIWTARWLEAEQGSSQEWVGVAGAAVLRSTECPIPSDHVSYKKHTLCVFVTLVVPWSARPRLQSWCYFWASL